MDLQTALAIVAQAASLAPLPRPAHAQVDQALLALAAALEIDLGGDQPARPATSATKTGHTEPGVASPPTATEPPAQAARTS
jgi:hypothetical protein